MRSGGPSWQMAAWMGDAPPFDSVTRALDVRTAHLTGSIKITPESGDQGTASMIDRLGPLFTQTP